MTIELLQSFFGWSALLNIGLLTSWLLMFWLTHNWIYRFHGDRFKISVEAFDAIHYAGMATYKVGIFLFNLVPYLALQIID